MSATQIRGSTQIIDGTIGAVKVDTTIIKASGANAFTGDQSMGGNKLTSVAAPVSGGDAANKTYVDNLIQGLNQKPTARAATTAALAANTYNNGTAGFGATLTGNANNTQLTIDGVTLAVNDIILVLNEAAPENNGLYTVTQIADSTHPYIFTRHVDMDTDGEFNGALIPVDQEGTTNKNTLWLANFVSGFTVGTTAVTFVQLNSATAYTGSNGINVSGNVISPTYGSSANTICQGNDSRLSDARTPVGTALTSANLWLGNGSNVAAAVAMSGDVTITNAGVTTVANQVKLSKYIVRETPSGTINGSNVTFTLANTPVSGSEQVFLNGILQEPGSGNDYTISGATITYLIAPISGDRLRVTYISQ